MIAAISTDVFDPSGFVLIDVMPGTALPERRRRTNRISTLDGGAVSNDFGYSDADLIIVVKWVPSEAVDAAIDTLVRTYGTVNVATPDGVFSAAVEAFMPGPSESSLRLLVLARLSAI